MLFMYYVLLFRCNYDYISQINIEWNETTSRENAIPTETNKDRADSIVERYG